MIDQHLTLHRFAGAWMGDMVYPSKTAQYYISARLALEGCAVIADAEQTENGHITFCAHKVFSYYPYQQVFTYHFFDSEGATPLQCAQGDWKDECLQLEQQTPFGKVRYSYTFSGNDVFDYKMEVSEDGEHWQDYQHGSFRRVAAHP
jgi:hypothetical protein